MNTYKLTHEGYVIKNGTDKVPTTTSDAAPNTNPDYIEYLAWLDAGNVPEPADPLSVVVPKAVTMRQGREMLIRQGLFAQVDAAINSIADPMEKAIALNYWEKSQVMERDNAVVLQLAPALGLSDAQLDAMFIQASTL